MDIADWRKRIDDIDSQLVKLINERARIAQEIGRLKRNSQAPIYEPEREKLVFEHVCRVNGGPLPDRSLIQVYERLIDVMRNLQKDEMLPADSNRIDSSGGDTELEAELND